MLLVHTHCNAALQAINTGKCKCLEFKSDAHCNRIVLLFIGDQIAHGIRCRVLIIEIGHQPQIKSDALGEIIPQTKEKEWASRAGLICSVKVKSLASIPTSVNM